MASTLQNTIEFLKDFGLFDVVLPFLLVFAIVFGILEKTMLLGKDKKNLNSVVALVVAFMTIAANKAVNAISAALPNVVLLMVVGLSFLLLIGVFVKQGELDLEEKHKGLYTTFLVIMFVGVVIISLGAYQVNGDSALTYILEKVNLNDSLVSGLILLAVVVGIIYYITKGSGGESKP